MGDKFALGEVVLYWPDSFSPRAVKIIDIFNSRFQPERITYKVRLTEGREFTDILTDDTVLLKYPDTKSGN